MRIRSAVALGVVALVAAGASAAEPQAPSPPGTYMVIPVKGHIGRDATVVRVKSLLTEAERLKPGAVILEIDSGGGSIVDAEGLIDLIIARKDLRMIALVHKALSAAAPLALSCREIHVTERATLGGAVSFALGPDGLPVRLPGDVAEKFQSVWRAVCRKAAEHGGHPALLAEAMVDPAFALTARRTADGYVFERDGTGETMKGAGRILTLTAREAVRYGVAKGMAADLAALRRDLGMGDWTEVGAAASRAAADDPAARRGTPEDLYERSCGKAAVLGLSGATTELQRTVAQEQLNAWLAKEALDNPLVEWTLSLIEVSQYDEARIQGEIGRTETRLRQERMRAAVKDREYRNGIVTERPAFPQARLDVIRLTNHLATLQRIHREITQYPLIVFAQAPGEPRCLVCAQLRQDFRKALGSMPPQTDFRLKGNLDGMELHWGADIGFILVVRVGKGELPSDASGPAAPAAPADANPQMHTFCKGALSMARNYLRAGLPDKAEPHLREVIARFPDSTYAQEARRMLAEIGSPKRP